MDSSIEKFIPVGSISIWKYSEKNPLHRHWNLTADTKGCDSLLELLSLMQVSQFSSKKTVRLALPTDQQINVPNNRNAKWHSKLILELKYTKSNNDQWQLYETNNTIEIIAGNNKLIELCEVLKKIKNNKGDFAISDGNDDNVLYFWWNTINR